MSGLNKVQLIGNLGRDPEIRTSQAGDDIANLAIATSEVWKDKHTGERKERTEWHRIAIFDPNLARVAGDWLRKGSRIYVEGQLQTRKYTDQQGIERYSTEVVLQRFRGTLIMLDTRRDAPSQDDYGTTRTRQPATTPAGRDDGTLDDEIPL